jgi:hypothetical protein
MHMASDSSTSTGQATEGRRVVARSTVRPTMDANDNSPRDGHDSIDSDDHADRHLLGDEQGIGHMMAEQLVEPAEAAVEIEQKDSHLAVRLREGTDSRGLTTTWLLTPEDARSVADRLATVAAEVEDD